MTSPASAVKNKLHTEALAYAARGTPVFPCWPNTKKPIPRNGLHAATTDRKQIDAWWTEHPDANIAFVPASIGQAVIDLDGEEGMAAWRDLGWDFDCPETLVVQTPRGGQHWYYAGTVPPSQWAPGRKRCLGEHIDTRGLGSYALLPPSVTDDGIYTVLHDREIAKLPEWIPAKLAPTATPLKASNVTLDEPRNIDRAMRMLKARIAKAKDLPDEQAARYVAVQGKGGDAHTLQLCMELKDMGVSQERIPDVLEESGWNAACRPPWDIEGKDSLGAKAANAYKSGQNEPGSKVEPPLEEIFAPALEKARQKAKEALLARIGDGDIRKVQRARVTWLWRDYIPLGMYSVLAGRGDTGKSAMLIDFIARVTNGKMWPDGRHQAPQGRVILFNIEDNKKLILKARLEAAGVDLSMVRVYDRTWADGTPINFSLPEHRELLDELIALDGAILVVIDPITSFAAGINHDNESEVRGVLDPLSDIAEKHGCAIVGNRHGGKGHKNDDNPNNSVLGSVAHTDIPRSVLQVASTDDELETRQVRVLEQTKYNVSEKQRPLQYIIEVVDMETGEVIPHGTMVDDPSTRIKYLGHASTSIRELRMQRPNKPGPDDEVVQEVVRFYQEYLGPGPQTNKRIKAAAQAHGFSQRTMARARVKLGVKYFYEGPVQMITLPGWHADKQEPKRAANDHDW